MLRPRYLALISLLAVAVPAASVGLEARQQWSPAQIWTRSNQSPAYNSGYSYGVTAGEEDGRRGQSYNYADENNYRRGDLGYRSEYGNRDRYRDDFRRGFESGYRVGYDRFARSGGYGNPGGGYGNYGGYGTYGRNDLAFEKGFADGYNEGIKDGRDRHRNDPLAESRYRSGTHGYESWYGPKDAYKLRYRDAFRSGYEQGYREGRPW
jgi:hypothetical protein